MSKVLVNESSLTGIADAIRGKNGSTDTYKPSEMAAAITAISGGGGEPTIEALSITANGTYTAPDGVDGYSPVTVNVPQDGGPPEEAFVLSGNMNHWDYNGKWDKFITAYADKWSTSNITDTSYMFYGCDLAQIPFEINSGNTIAFTYMFYGSNLTTLPTIIGNNVVVNSTNNFLSFNSKIKNIPDNYFNFIGDVNNYASVNGMFSSCSSLRNFPSSVNILPQKCKSSTYSSFYYTMCPNCYVLDEITNLGVSTLIAYTSNTFNTFVSNCYRLKNFTFEPDKIVMWKNQTIDLTNYVGYTDYESRIVNNGITADKRVTDDATYQALKDDPDWWTKDIAYSRYNHDSAVATINSLPDASAYLAANGGTNTIKFKGESGSATDGGAISSLTPEEIAVATSRGWTVSLV